MEKLNFNTKKAQRYIELYDRAKTGYINDMYKTGASTAKIAAETLILARMQQAGGYGYRILSHNQMFFTCAWRTDIQLIVETPAHTYEIQLPF